jgi:hypothetical protein
MSSLFRFAGGFAPALPVIDRIGGRLITVRGW